MKNLFFILCLFILSYFNLNAKCCSYWLQWVGYYPNFALVELNDIASKDYDAAWVVGNNGTILTTSSAFYPIAQESNTYEDLLSISLVSNSLIWVSGNNGTILKTSNGGNTWSQCVTNLTDNITCIDFTNENVGWAIGSNGNILRTVDAGESWNIFPDTEFQGLKRICVTDQNNAWAVGNNGKILQLTYSNYSITYTNKSQPGLTTNLNDLAFFDSNVGWVVGDSCTCLKTNDGGNTWVSMQDGMDIVPGDSLIRVSFVDQNHVYVTSSKIIAYTENGGLEWSNLYNENDYSSLKAICMINEDYGYAIDSEGSVILVIGDYFYYTYCLNSPIDGATNVSINPVLTWELIWGGSTYYIEVATDSLFENIVSYEYNKSGFNYHPGPLEYNTKYYWRMKRWEEGIWSDVWSFTTCEAPAYLDLEIPLSYGWNLISSNVIPEEPAMESVFEDMSNIVLVKNGIGQIYSPAFGINEIGNWNVEAGYYVYTNAACILNISGDEANTYLQRIGLNAGWDIVSYLRNSPMDVQQALSSISSNLIMVKNNSGGIYHPGYGINTLGEMQRGQGYWLYISSPALLTYPEN